MSIQRWVGIECHESPDGDMVAYGDHVAAVAALIDDQAKEIEQYVKAVAEAEQRGYDRAKRIYMAAGQAAVTQAFSDARDAVAAIEHWTAYTHNGGVHSCYASDPLAAIDALRGQESRPGYHSQRCLHCDHIRATHTLTANGCIGHALPGKPGADCPCAKFEEASHD